MNSLQTPPIAAGRANSDSGALRLIRILLPVAVLAAGIAAWELVVRLNSIPPYVLPAPSAVFVTLVADWPVLSQSLLTTLLTTLEGFAAAAIGGCRAGAGVQSIEMAGIFAVSLCRDPAGHPGDCDRAAPFDLPVAANRRYRLRLDRRLLSRAVQHHARSQFRGSQPGRLIPALRRFAAADAAVSQITGSAAVHSRRIADRWWTVLDRCGGGRDRGGVRRCGVGPRLSNRRIRLSSQHSPNVRRTAVALGRRNCHLWAASANFAFGVAALARERAWKGKTDGGRKYFIGKDRLAGLRAEQADRRQRLFRPVRAPSV